MLAKSEKVHGAIFDSRARHGFDRAANILIFARMRQFIRDSSGNSLVVVTLQQVITHCEVHDIDQFEPDLLQLRLLLLPPFPAVMIEHFRAFRPDRAVPGVASLAPVGVDAGIHRILHLEHDL